MTIFHYTAGANADPEAVARAAAWLRSVAGHRAKVSTGSP
jgi:hypothetical protein